ncbi:hypothetical protein [Virgibacillus salexigens]|uniref:Uncharacterized protein n=1 Tax=Virgibacillus massiliensis TaxID=1462526 RepID=A0A024Q897_9BACI|nr:hypothetical protein [Virgibacillus massiliensis]CDQ38724.1 hypothetical protein BN990_00997 [Virgibacillus massiliensis]
MPVLWKSLKLGISFVFIYVLIVFSAPFIIRLMGTTSVSSSPTMFQFSLYSINIRGNTFESEATIMGLFISLILGTVIYYIFHSLNKG